VVVLLLLVATTFTHAFGSALIFYIALSVWGFGVLRRDQTSAAAAITILVLLFFIIPVGWVFYWGSDTFVYLTQSASSELVNMSFLSLFGSGLSRGQAQFGESIPLWIRGPRLFWFALLYASPGLLWLWSLTRVRRLGPTWIRLVAAYSGLAMLTVATSLSLKGGAAELRRSLTYGAFLGIPFGFLLLRQYKPLVTRVAMLGMASLLVLLSLPSFLGNALGIATWTFYDSEYATGAWVQSIYGTGKGLNIFVTHYVSVPVQFYLTDATATSDRQTHAYVSFDEEGVWQSMDEFLDKFDRFSQSGGVGLFIYSPKMALYTATIFGISPGHPRRRDMTDRLSRQNHRIYDNGRLIAYSSKVSPR
jgi:hypothetical protein